MWIKIQEIFNFASATPQSKKIINGEDLLNRGHLLTCGKICNDSDVIKIIGYCLQISNIEADPHEISGEILSDGQILNMNCTCKASLKGACKHIVAVLLYCYRNDLDSLKIISCTDKKHTWSTAKKKLLEEYKMKPLMLHSCFANKIKNQDIDCIDAGQVMNDEDEIRRIMIENNPSSALAMHLSLRS